MPKQILSRLLLSVFVAAVSSAPMLFWQAATGRAMAKNGRPNGAKIYENTCARCHNAPEPRQRSPQSWQTIMAHMRVRGGLTADETAAVLAFLKEQTQPPMPTRGEQAGERKTTDRVAAGRKLLEDLNCLACHSLGGKGSEVGPPLDDVGLRRTREQLLARMRARRAGDIMPTLPPNMSNEEINQLVDYLASLKGKVGK